VAGLIVHSFASGGREALVVFATHIWTLVAGLATQSVLAWTLGPAGRGEYAVCMLFGGTLGVVFMLGIDRAAQYFVMSKAQSLSHGASAAIIAALGASAIAIVIGIVLMRGTIPFFHKADADAFAVALALIPLTVLTTTLQLQLAGLRRFASLARVSIVQASCTLVLIVLLAGGFRLGVIGAVVAQAVSLTLVVGLLLRELHVACGFTLSLPRAAHFREQLAYGSRYYVARIGNLIDSGLGVFIIAMFATREEIGLFAAASALVLKVLVLSDSVEAALLPRIAADPEGRTELVGRCVRICGLFTAVAAAAIVAVSVPLVSILLSPKFMGAVPLIAILAPGIVLYGGSQILMAFFRGTGRPGTCSLVIWVGLVANIVTLIVLYPRFGLPAAAWATTVSYAGRVCVLFACYRRVTGQGPAEVLHARRSDLAAIRSVLREFLGKRLRVFND